MDPTETSDSHDAEVQGLKGGGQLSIEHRYPASRGSLARCSGVDVLWRQGESMLPACLGCLGTLYLVGHLRPNISYREEAGVLHKEREVQMGVCHRDASGGLACRLGPKFPGTWHEHTQNGSTSATHGKLA